MPAINKKVSEKATPTPQATSGSNFQLQFLLLAAILGLVAGIVFIIIQPLFGMDTLTSRHAAFYQQLGGWGSVPAVMIAWTAHLLVSIFYGLLCAILLLNTLRLALIALGTLLFTWITTVIAPPANAMIVQLVSFQQLHSEKLPPLNFSLDVKFLLHLVFFAAISFVLYLYAKKAKQ
ncbi:hypothetical protein EH243_18070 [Amphritea opalescens]|uniref:Uncharacterized protein n=1 Tax=Amphritea opalescens TaxID=2490544 RepID=A0A430KLL1_9GAMM|nr:hypothetical protein [Amphritea opalescens]RTE64324.1 hypothetical protein EH243_18070 [Amphritea opalescens]